MIVAMGTSANPGQAVAGDFPKRLGGLALRKPPDELPLVALHWVFGLAVTHLDCFVTQMGLYGERLVPDHRRAEDLLSSATLVGFHSACVHRI